MIKVIKCMVIASLLLVVNHSFSDGIKDYSSVMRHLQRHNQLSLGKDDFNTGNDGKKAVFYINTYNPSMIPTDPRAKTYIGSISFTPEPNSSYKGGRLQIVPGDSGRFSVNELDNNGNKVNYLGTFFFADGALDMDNIDFSTGDNGKKALFYMNAKSSAGSKLYVGSTTFVPEPNSSYRGGKLHIVPGGTGRFSINEVDNNGNKVNYLGTFFIAK